MDSDRLLTIHVGLHGQLRRFRPADSLPVPVQVAEGTTVREIARRLGAQDEVWLSTIDGTAVPLSTPLTKDGAVDFYPCLEGG